MDIETAIKIMPDEKLIEIHKSLAEEIRRRRLYKRKDKRVKKMQTLEDFVRQHQKKNYKQIVELIESYNLTIDTPAVPRHLNTALINPNRKRSYTHILQQDWSEVYPRTSDEGDYYVYAHVDPLAMCFCAPDELGGNFNGLPFYIGKGTNRRAYDLKRNQGHGKKIRQVLKEGSKPEEIVHIAFNGLSEQYAYEIESKLIYFFGSIYEKLRGKHTCLYNLDIPKKPELSQDMLISNYTKRGISDMKKYQPWKGKNKHKEAGQ